MTPLDWIIVACVAAFVLAGAAQGFLTSALALAGFVGGALLGTRLAPLVLDRGSASPYAPLFALLGAVLGGALVAGWLGELGARVRARIRLPALGAADALLGGVLAACVALGMVWVLGAVALQTPGARDLRRDVQRSQILRRLNRALPPSGSLLNALARFDPIPRVTGPSALLAPPRSAILRDPDVRAASASVVKVVGTACGLGLEGSGWVADGGLVVTNAHVVAGERDTTVQAGGAGPGLPAQAIAFNAHDDVAVLRVPGLQSTPLPIAGDPRPGTPAAIVGYPENGPLTGRPGRIGDTVTVLTQDAYGRGPVRRRLTILRGRVRPGNSGGPLIDDRGRVLTTVFAAALQGPAGGYGVPNAIVRAALQRARGPVSTGPCVG